MSKGDLAFTTNDRHSLGVELELQLVDKETYALKSIITELLERLPKKYHAYIKPELMQCYLEINTDICETVADVSKDLSEKIHNVRQTAEELDTFLFWSATHPFSPLVRSGYYAERSLLLLS